MNYGYQKTVTIGFDEAEVKVRGTLMEQGFGILSEIDVKKAFKEKLNINFQRYTILGACNPALAHQALTSELEVGMLMPCNVVIWENKDSSVTISAADAKELLSVTDADLSAIAIEANECLKTAIDAV